MCTSASTATAPARWVHVEDGGGGSCLLGYILEDKHQDLAEGICCLVGMVWHSHAF